MKKRKEQKFNTKGEQKLFYSRTESSYGYIVLYWLSFRILKIFHTNQSLIRISYGFILFGKSLEVFVASNKFRNLQSPNLSALKVQCTCREKKRERKNRELRICLFSFYSCILGVHFKEHREIHGCLSFQIY